MSSDIHLYFIIYLLATFEKFSFVISYIYCRDVKLFWIFKRRLEGWVIIMYYFQLCLKLYKIVPKSGDCLVYLELKNIFIFFLWISFLNNFENFIWVLYLHHFCPYHKHLHPLSHNCSLRIQFLTLMNNKFLAKENCPL